LSGLGRVFFAGKLLENGWQGDTNGAAEGIDGRPRCGSELRPAAVLLDLNLAQVGKVVEDALPFERLRAAGRQAVDQFLSQHEREEGNEDVATNGGVSLVEDGAGGEQRLGGLEGILDIPYKRPLII
jgi:hypothetical protein